MAKLFEGKTAFVTGASAGIGEAAAREFARQGAKVALTARRAERLDRLRNEIEGAGGTALALPCDVTDRASLDAAVAHCVEAFGGIDVVLANAGFSVSGVISRLETADFRRQFDTNVFGVLETVFATLPHLEASKGRLGLVASVMGRLGLPASSAYCSSKFALAGLAEALYYDLADSGVSVTCINPGLVSSELRSVNNRGKYTGKPDPAPGFLVMPAETAARQLVRALYRRKPECVITLHGKLAVFLARHFPRTLRMAVRAASKGRLAKVERLKRGDPAD